MPYSQETFSIFVVSFGDTVQAIWSGVTGLRSLVKFETVCSLYDVPVIPHGHSLRAAVHTLFNQSPSRVRCAA